MSPTTIETLAAGSSAASGRAFSLSGGLARLVFHPTGLIRAVQSGTLTPVRIVAYALVFSLLSGLAFSTLAVLTAPPAWNMHGQQAVMRFLFIFTMMTMIFIPLATVFWAMIQKYACWFWGVSVPFRTLFLLSALGCGYFTLMFVSSVPLYWLQSIAPLVTEIVLFLLNISACGLSLRWMKQAYVTLAGVKRRKAWVVALSPVFTLVVLWLVTLVLSLIAGYGNPLQRSL